MATVTQYSAVNLIADAKVDPDRWSRVPDEATIDRTVGAIEARNVRVVRTATADGARQTLLDLIPEGAEVMNGSSTTLNEIGYEQLLKENSKGWRDYHAVITAENDDQKREALRRRGVAADWFLSGVQAIAATGELVGCDKTGSRVGAWPYSAGHLVLVSGVNKIAPTLEDALARCWEYALPVEQQRAKRVYGTSSEIGNIVILEKEMARDRVTLILIGESLGY
ncbi:MAG: lactate utilization protein [Methanospirillum sp.]